MIIWFYPCELYETLCFCFMQLNGNLFVPGWIKNFISEKLIAIIWIFLCFGDLRIIYDEFKSVLL